MISARCAAIVDKYGFVVIDKNNSLTNRYRNGFNVFANRKTISRYQYSVEVKRE